MFFNLLLVWSTVHQVQDTASPDADRVCGVEVGDVAVRLYITLRSSVSLRC